MEKQQEREGGWILLRSGNRWWPADPRPEEIHVEDVAHNLSNECRFSGATEPFYSVLQHMVYCHDIVVEVAEERMGLKLTDSLRRDLKKQALLHDAHEFGGIRDMPSPIKGSIPGYKTIEFIVWEAMCMRFCLPIKMHPAVKMADNVALVTERRDLMPATGWLWHNDIESIVPHREKLIPLSPAAARSEFFKRFYELMPDERKSC